MENRTFDALTKTIAVSNSRRSFLNTAAGGFGALALTAMGRRVSLAAPGGATPVEVERATTPDSQGGLVADYYFAINVGSYSKAYGLLGSSLQSRHSLSEFIDGFATTAFDELVITSINYDNAQQKITYHVSVTAWQTDGNITRFAGTYTQGKESGHTKIVAASLTAVAPGPVSALCTADNLSAGLTGDAGAGQRYGTVTVTNSGAHTCVMGTIPKVTIKDGGGKFLISSRPENGVPIGAVTLKPGQSSSLNMHWGNWCGADVSGTPRVDVALNGGRGSLSGLKGIGVPPCNSEPGGLSTLTVEPWA